jgi:hypothetical protein
MFQMNCKLCAASKETADLFTAALCRARADLRRQQERRGRGLEYTRDSVSVQLSGSVTATNQRVHRIARIERP